MSQDTSRQYDNDGVTRIIRRALKLNNQDAISHNELMDTASQIEPHFLFNTLSNILNLMDTDPEKGKSMLEDFTRYLRTSLSKIRGQATRFGHEMEMIRASGCRSKLPTPRLHQWIWPIPSSDLGQL